MDWDDPAARAALIENVGIKEYNRRFKIHIKRSTKATVNGHDIRQVGSRFGTLWLVGNTNRAFRTFDEAKDYATNGEEQLFPTTFREGAMKKKPIQVWVKYKDDDVWLCVFDTHSPPLAYEYAKNRISFGGVARVEVRDAFGKEVLETVFDHTWK